MSFNYPIRFTDTKPMTRLLCSVDKVGPSGRCFRVNLRTQRGMIVEHVLDYHDLFPLLHAVETNKVRPVVRFFGNYVTTEALVDALETEGILQTALEQKISMGWVPEPMPENLSA